jgi:threonine dehydrogenase-like Zn-dependent dehydrogenase
MSDVTILLVFPGSHDSNKADLVGANEPARTPRVAIVGTGLVGATTAYALLLSGLSAQIVLINRDKERARAHVDDLRDAELFSHTSQIILGDFSDCCDCDIVVITVGASQSSVQVSRLDDSAPKPNSRPSRRHLAINAPAASRIATAILTARAAGSGIGTGSMKKTMIMRRRHETGQPTRSEQRRGRAHESPRRFGASFMADPGGPRGQE